VIDAGAAWTSATMRADATIAYQAHARDLVRDEVGPIMQL
jgi:hypothetical protein